MVTQEQKEEALRVMKKRDIPLITSTHLMQEMMVDKDTATEILEALLDDGSLNSWYATQYTKVYWIDEEL